MIRIDWTTDAGALLAIEPTTAEIAQHSLALSTGYNEPTNAELMGHANVISPGEVVESYADSIAAGMRAFLLFVDPLRTPFGSAARPGKAGTCDYGEFVGDADLRNFRGTTAEFAFMVAAPSAQGKGLGTRFATMLHQFGFGSLDLERIYASVVPQNTASRRVFEKLGYVVDDSAAAREYAEEPGDIVLVLRRAAFRPLPDIKIGAR